MKGNSKIDQLTELPNIGKVLAQRLIEIGVDTPQKLNELGTERTFIQIKALDPEACFCKLCAIDGAIKSVRWHDLPDSDKEALKEFFHLVNKA